MYAEDIGYTDANRTMWEIGNRWARAWGAVMRAWDADAEWHGPASSPAQAPPDCQPCAALLRRARRFVAAAQDVQFTAITEGTHLNETTPWQYVFK